MRGWKERIQNLKTSNHIYSTYLNKLNIMQYGYEPDDETEEDRDYPLDLEAPLLVSNYHQLPADPTQLEGLNFVAFDVETAERKLYTICQVGVAVVRNGQIIESKSWLIQPPNNQYHWGNTKVHGITAKHTMNSPTFDVVWTEIEPYLKGNLIMMHNAAFDAKCLMQALRHYKIAYCFAWKGCSMLYAKALLKLTSYSLSSIADHYGLLLQNAHDAEQDARMTATVLLAMAKEFKIQDNGDFYTVTRVEFGQMAPDVNHEPFAQVQPRASQTKSGQFEGIISSDKLKGKTFVFTGATTAASRAQLEELVWLHNGKLSNAVSKRTAYLVKDDDSESGKTRKAKENGTPVITSEAFLKLIDWQFETFLTQNK